MRSISNSLHKDSSKERMNFAFSSKRPHANNKTNSKDSSYSVPFCLRILNCSGDRIARHSSSGLLTDPGAGEAIAVIRPPWKPRPRRRSGGRTLGFEGEKVSRVVLRETEGLTKALMVEAKVIQVAEDDDDMTFSAIVALSLSFFFSLSSDSVCYSFLVLSRIFS